MIRAWPLDYMHLVKKNYISDDMTDLIDKFHRKSY